MFLRFVKTNVSALENQSFRDRVGPQVVIVNLIILNWLCWWLATCEVDSMCNLTEERLRLWSLMWGDGQRKGYFSTLPEKYQAETIEKFDEQNFESVILASIYDIYEWCSINKNWSSDEYLSLRQVIRCAVVQPCWQVSPIHAHEAAKLINHRPTTILSTDGLGVAKAISDLACERINESEIIKALATEAGIPTSSVSFIATEHNLVPRIRRPVMEARLLGAHLTHTSVTKVLAAWIAIEKLPSYDLKWDDGKAKYGEKKEDRWIYYFASEKQEILEHIDPPFAPYAKWVHKFVANVGDGLSVAPLKAQCDNFPDTEGSVQK